MKRKEAINSDIIGITQSRGEFDLSIGNSVKILYDANGATCGSVPIDTTGYESRTKVTVKDEGTLEKSMHTFIGWNTKADGTGTTYRPRETFFASASMTLYAMWKGLSRVGGRVYYMHEANGLTYTFYDKDGNVLNVKQENTTAENAIRNTTSSNLWNKVAYYSTSGTKTGEDKFYAYENTLSYASNGLDYGIDWGAYDTLVAETNPKYVSAGSGFIQTTTSEKLPTANDENVAPMLTAIGAGKQNTDECLRKTDAASYAHPTVFQDYCDGTNTIWTWIRNMRDATKAGTIGNTTGLYDWFIPSTDELEQLRLSGLVSAWFDSSADSYIWSSVEYDSCHSWDWDNDNSSWYNGNTKVFSDYNSVVAVRSF